MIASPKTRKLRLSLEEALRRGKLKGKFIKNRFIVPVGKASFFEFGLVPVILISPPLLFSLLYLSELIKFWYHDALTSWLASGVNPAILSASLALFFFLLFCFSLIKENLVIDFDQGRIYRSYSFLGKTVKWDYYYTVTTIFEITYIAVDTVVERKKITNKNKIIDYVKFDLRTIQSRNLNLISKYFDFSSSLRFYRKDGSAVTAVYETKSEREFKILNEQGSGLAEAFGVPFISCQKSQKIKKDENGELKAVPVFDEEDYKDMEDDARGCGSLQKAQTIYEAMEKRKF